MTIPGGPWRVDTYLTRKAQQHWPQAIVDCDSADPVPPAGATGDVRRFRLSRPGMPDLMLGAGGFRGARTALAQLSTRLPG